VAHNWAGAPDLSIRYLAIFGINVFQAGVTEMIKYREMKTGALKLQDWTLADGFWRPELRTMLNLCSRVLSQK